MEYIVSFASCFDGISIGKQFVVKDSLKNAISLAVKLAKENGATEPDEDLFNEINNDMSYASDDGEWGVFIGIPEND